MGKTTRQDVPITCRCPAPQGRGPGQGEISAWRGMVQVFSLPLRPRPTSTPFRAQWRPASLPGGRRAALPPAPAGPGRGAPRFCGGGGGGPGGGGGGGGRGGGGGGGRRRRGGGGRPIGGR